ncbi:SCP2 sterol-binding domain-containing protein [Rubellimicrobium sp. CFH 75288]|uniref:SCP2 sterol-binding domain-containing protein n=1 Tax=Rubellimicrobium sp. CFH 75288 TaxID=2697034 RepID=UPI0014125B68|nr:SCP2 sterol-binding domain-containing protein [Rubellimicrobium sp. CFH 75288]NAZ35493.1 sterol carrier family protein [Rubellimicrobium sp. CFH 75288]
MSAVIDKAVEELNGRLAGKGFDGTALFVFSGEGSVVVDGAGARAGEAPADVTLTASPETFGDILSGETSATAAFMTGKLSVDGDMGAAMRLASLLG